METQARIPSEYRNISLQSYLVELDGKYPSYPTSAVEFILQMCEIHLPPHKLSVSGINYVNRSQRNICLLHGFWYNHQALIKVTDQTKNVIMTLFKTYFVDDATQQDVDMLCYKALGSLEVSPPHPKKARS